MSMQQRVSFDPAAHFQAVETRHAEVEDEQIWTEGSHLEQALVAVGRTLEFRPRPEIPQGIDDELHDDRIVIHNEDSWGLFGL